MYLDLLPSLRCRNHNAVQFPENIVHNTTSDFKIFPESHKHYLALCISLQKTTLFISNTVALNTLSKSRTTLSCGQTHSYLRCKLSRERMIVYTNCVSRIVYSCIFDTGNASSEANVKKGLAVHQQTVTDADKFFTVKGSMEGFFLNQNREKKKIHTVSASSIA